MRVGRGERGHRNSIQQNGEIWRKFLGDLRSLLPLSSSLKLPLPFPFLVLSNPFTLAEEQSRKWVVFCTHCCFVGLLCGRRGDGSWVKPELNKQLTKAPRVDLEIRRENVGQRPCRGQGTAALKERSQHCKCGHSPPFTIREWKLFSHHNSRLSRQRIPLSLIGDLGITWNHVHKIVLKLYSSVQMLWWIPLSPLPSSLLFQIGLVGAWAAHNDLPFQVWFTGQHKDSFHHYFLGNSLQINTVTWYSTFLVKYFFFPVLKNQVHYQKNLSYPFICLLFIQLYNGKPPYARKYAEAKELPSAIASKGYQRILTLHDHIIYTYKTFFFLSLFLSWTKHL